jgi:hypothetical protein
MPALAPPRLGRDLVTPKLFARLTARLEADHPEVADNAGRIVDQTLAFLAACGANPEAELRPSRPVDLGWHTFLLFTQDYSLFCRRIAGRFIHHIPDDATDRGNAPGPADTIAAVEAAGYTVEPDLWARSSTCHPCHEEGCSGTGRNGDENKESQNPTK